MRILMIIHTRWSRNLGAARVQMELAEEWIKMGHSVKKFSYEDAFPKKQSRLEELTCNFSTKAKTFVKENCHNFDIIDANQTDLPFRKQELKINKTLLVARSVGLLPLYKKFYEMEKLKWPQLYKPTLKSFVKHFVTYSATKRRYGDVLPSFKTADLINVANTDELVYVRDIMGLGHKCVCFPFGLSSERQEEFAHHIQPANLRLANKEIVFIGTWCNRKGSKDWGEIIRRVRSQVPEAKFLFLGTGYSREYILNDLNLSSCDWIRIISNFESEELPKFLAGATVGAFPSYIEGFGFAVLEKLACGLPNVVYDVPGPREMMRYLDVDWRVPAGDLVQFSNRIVSLLNLTQEQYSVISKDCLEVAKKFSWHEIARQTIDTYSEYLDRQKLVK